MRILSKAHSQTKMTQLASTQSSKDRLLKATARLLAERGYDGVGLALIAKAAKTTTGSLYFHFPDGKEALAVASIEAAAEGRGRRMAEVLTESGPASIAYLWADHLESSDWKVGCPVAATTLQMSSRSEALRQAGQRAFDLWRGEIVRYLVDVGWGAEQARVASRQILSLLEGAELLARTERNRFPLEEAAEAIERLLQSFSEAAH